MLVCKPYGSAGRAAPHTPTEKVGAALHCLDETIRRLTYKQRNHTLTFREKQVLEELNTARLLLSKPSQEAH